MGKYVFQHPQGKSHTYDALLRATHAVEAFSSGHRSHAGWFKESTKEVTLKVMMKILVRYLNYACLKSSPAGLGLVGSILNAFSFLTPFMSNLIESIDCDRINPIKNSDIIIQYSGSM
jgi:hypothetical protein